MPGRQEIKFRKLFDLSDLPSDWAVTRVSFDWNADPLVLIEEGKPPQPKDRGDFEAVVAWMNALPKAHHVIHWVAGRRQVTTFEKSTGNATAHIQRYGDGWLLGEARGGMAPIYDSSGKRTGRTLDLGDASEDVQTTADGHIWVSYFDEGVFGSGISTAGLVCFDESGTPIFKYSEFAEKHNLPAVDDLYALNVVDSTETWFCYYSDFPLVRLRNFELANVWRNLPPTKCFAVDQRGITSARAYEHGKILRSTTADHFREHVELSPVDGSGSIIEPPFKVSARREHMCIRTAREVYINSEV